MANMKKRLTKSSTDKQISGVAGGIADYFGIDPTIVRLLFVVFTLTGGPGLIAYIVLAIVMAEPGTSAEKALESTWDEATNAFDRATDAVTNVVNKKTAAQPAEVTVENLKDNEKTQSVSDEFLS